MHLNVTLSLRHLLPVWLGQVFISKPRVKCLAHCRYQISKGQTSLVAQWLRIHLPMQGTRVRALVREDPTCHGAIKPVRHSC